MVTPEHIPAALPPDVVAYKRTPVFDETTLPDGLRKRHNTKEGVWGVLHMLEGRLRFRWLEPLSEHLLEPGARPMIIPPQKPHEVSPLGPVRFYVEFHKKPE